MEHEGSLFQYLCKAEEQKQKRIAIVMENNHNCDEKCTKCDDFRMKICTGFNSNIFIDIFFGNNATIRTTKEYLTQTIILMQELYGIRVNRIEVVNTGSEMPSYYFLRGKDRLESKGEINVSRKSI